MTDIDAVALRQEWEAAQAARVADQQRRHEADMARLDAFEAVSWEMRIKLTEKLSALLESLEPYVDGTMGEVTAGMAAVYVKAAHEMATLYQATRPLRAPVAAPVLPEPELVQSSEQAEKVRREAVSALRAAAAAQLSSVKAKMIEARQPERASWETSVRR